MASLHTELLKSLTKSARNLPVGSSFHDIFLQYNYWTKVVKVHACS